MARPEQGTARPNTVKDIRVGCSLCHAAGHCICHDEESLWLEFLTPYGQGRKSH